MGVVVLNSLQSAVVEYVSYRKRLARVDRWCRMKQIEEKTGGSTGKPGGQKRMDGSVHFKE